MHITGQKGTTLDTDKGKQHPRCFAKAQRTREEGSSVRRLGIFCSTQSAHDLNQQNRNCTSHSPEENTKKSHRSLRPEQSGSMTTATVQLFFLTLFVHASYDVNIFSVQRCRIKVINASDKDQMPLGSQGL